MSRLMNDSELCLAAILEYLATDVGLRGNVDTLAGWAFWYTFDAYWNFGEYNSGQSRPEDIPE